jgi:pimeloyl-ACP methyl ester carboxylesterase
VRPQLSPAEGVLAHERRGPAEPPAVVLLHGLGASRSVWKLVDERLAARGLPVLMPDLLGFGGSRPIGTRFELLDHVRALCRLLEAIDAQRTVVAGHSFGCAVAVALAAHAPARVDRLVLVCPPVYRDRGEARERLGRRGWLARQVLSGSPAARASCQVMCLLRRPAGRILPRLVPDLPETLVRDSVEHSWPAYRDGVASLLEDNPLPAAIAHPTHPTTVLLGDDDQLAPPSDVLDGPHHAVDVRLLPSDHLLPVRWPEPVAAAIAAGYTDVVS